MLDLRVCELNKLNTLTKYPSIETYHALDPRNGLLQEEAMPFDGDLVLTEKVDGTNARIISFPNGDYAIGSRSELLHARGDLISNPALGIVAAIKSIAERLEPDSNMLQVWYGEVFGGKVTSASKQYTGERRIAFRLFDVCAIPDADELIARPLEAISNWREHKSHHWLNEERLTTNAEKHGLVLTPRIGVIAASELPQTVEDMAEFLAATLPSTLCALDEAAGGQAEGIVLREKKRGAIAKARFQDYRRTLKRRK